MNIALTGSSGLIGSKLLKYLRRTNPESYIKLTQELAIRRN